MSTPPLDLSLLTPPLREALKTLACCVHQAGGRALMVGGAVRDMLLKQTVSADVDVEVFGLSPTQLEKTLLQGGFPFEACGRAFGVLKLKHLPIDVSLPRRESKSGLGHKGFAIDSDPSLTPHEAAVRRDFTINAISFDPLTATLVDPFHGCLDLKQRTLRIVSPQFVEDPLRVLRGMQFIARLNLTATSETIRLCQKMTLEGLPPERLFEEWRKLLVQGIEIGKGLNFLRQTKWVRFFPEVESLIGCPQNPAWHPEGDVWNHTCLALDYFARHRVGEPLEDLIVGLAILCHDFGKPATTRFNLRKQAYSSHGHDMAGLAPTRTFLLRLTNEERLLKEIPPLVKCHMRPFALQEQHASDAAIRRLALEVGRVDRLARVNEADAAASGSGPANETHATGSSHWILEQAKRLAIADQMPQPILKGRDLIQLGYQPSPQFGPILKHIFEAQIEGAFTDLEGALRYARAYLSDLSTL